MIYLGLVSISTQVCYFRYRYLSLFYTLFIFLNVLSYHMHHFLYQNFWLRYHSYNGWFQMRYSSTVQMCILSFLKNHRLSWRMPSFFWCQKINRSTEFVCCLFTFYKFVINILGVHQFADNFKLAPLNIKCKCYIWQNKWLYHYWILVGEEGVHVIQFLNNLFHQYQIFINKHFHYVLTWTSKQWSSSIEAIFF